MTLKFYLLLLLVLFSSQVKSEENNDLMVELKNGKLKGTDKGNYYSYESIPYAKAPVGELRFEPPQPYDDKWQDVFDASKKLVKCMQWGPYEGGHKLEGSENCLFVSVYKPKTGQDKYPVLVYIHGGAFMFGSAQEFDENNLMNGGKVILVKVSYRLGPLGFVSTQDDSISGNYGLKDQLLALKWIKENIASFGGDAENILLFGFSSGGASTHLQMLNPELQNIAKAVISFSGVAFNPWAIIKNSYKKALKLAKHLKCPNVASTEAIKHCLKEKQAEEIVTSVKEFFNFGNNPFTIFGPVVEPKNSQQTFMTEHPQNIVKSGNYSHLPWLASYLAQDAGYTAGELLQINPKTSKPFLEDLNEKWLDLAPENLFLENIKDDPIKYAQQLKTDYIGNQSFSEENYLKVQEIYTDILFKNGVQEALRLHSKSNKEPVYGYIYDNPSKKGVASQRDDIKFGTFHGDDFRFLTLPTRHLRSDEQIIAHKFIKMLENFATSGELSFGDCTFVNNAGSPENLNLLLIKKDKCKNIIQ